MRLCPKCPDRGPLPDERFNKSRRECKDCQAAYKRDRRKGIFHPIIKPEIRVCRDCSNPESEERKFRNNCNQCVECYKKYLKEYRENNREIIQTAVSAWKIENRDRVRETERALYATPEGKQKHVDRVTATPRTWLSHLLSSIKNGSANPGRHSPKDEIRREFDLDLEYIVKIWDQQKGLCNLTNIPMTHKFNDLFAASIDRIDGRRGHIRGNIQIICQAMNMAKRHHSDEKAREFVAAIRAANCMDFKPEEFKFDDLQLMTPTVERAKRFYAKYHYMGLTKRRGVILGAYHQQQMVACATVDVLTRSEIATKQKLEPSQVRELARFCIHPDYHIKNLASWFLAKVVKMVRVEMPNIKLLVSFADSTVGHDGSIYLAGNWKYDGDTSPSYHYVKGNETLHKKTLFNRAVAVGMKEKEYVLANGYVKVLHKPKKRFLLSL